MDGIDYLSKGKVMTTGTCENCKYWVRDVDKLYPNNVLYWGQCRRVKMMNYDDDPFIEEEPWPAANFIIEHGLELQQEDFPGLSHKDEIKIIDETNLLTFMKFGCNEYKEK